MQKGKWLSEEALQTAEKKEEKQKAKEKKEGYKYLNAEFQRIARRDKKAFLSNQCKEIEENNRMGKTRDLFREGNGNPLQYSCLENSQGQKSLADYSPLSHKELDTTE